MTQKIHKTVPTWLPGLISLDQYKGSWELYSEAVHKEFIKDFVESKPIYEGKPIFVRYEPSYKLKGATFWHLVSEGTEESERIPDLRRCERIRWPRAIIENATSDDIKVWETTRTWKGQKQRRINFALDGFDYLVVIADSRNFDLVTAYPVERSHSREKLRKEFEIFLGQKKGGAAV